MMSRVETLRVNSIGSRHNLLTVNVVTNYPQQTIVFAIFVGAASTASLSTSSVSGVQGRIQPGVFGKPTGDVAKCTEYFKK